MRSSWLGRFDGLPVFDPAFVAKVAAFLRLALTLRRFAVFVHFFLNEASAFLDLTLHAHVVLHRFTQRLLSTMHKGPLLILAAQRGTSIRQFDPCGRVIARVLAPAHLAVNACIDQALQRMTIEQEMVDAEARISLPRISPVIPEGVNAVLGMKLSYGIGPTGFQKRLKRRAHLR